MLSASVVAMLALCLPFAFRFPFFGLCLYVWLDYVAPDRLFAGPFSETIRLSLLCGAATVGGWLIFEPKFKFGKSLALKFFLLFGIWVTITSILSVYPDTAWPKWERFIKNYTMILVGICIVDSRERLMIFLGTVFAATSIHAVKGAFITIMTGGGGYSVVGTEGTYLEERNYIAMAFLFGFWLGVFLWRFATRNDQPIWVRTAIAFCTVCCLISTIGTQSRGAFVAAIASAVVMLMFSKRKAMSLTGFAFVVGLAFIVAPDSWIERMQTIDNYDTDHASTSRLDTWKFAWEYAVSNPIFGGGYTIFRKNVSDVSIYGIYDAHSFYFEVLAEHGFVGLAIIIGFLLSLMGSLFVNWMKRKKYNDHGINDLLLFLLTACVGLYTAGVFGILSPFFMTYVPLLLAATFMKIEGSQLENKPNS